MAIGAEGNDYNTGFYGWIDELAVYSRALSATEITNIYAAGIGGKCALSLPPTIYAQPTNQTASLGGSATFGVGAGGSPNLTYQWSVNQTNIAGATNAILTVTNVQPTSGSKYAVLVTNAFGHLLSSNALLTVNPQGQVANATALGGAVSLPINLVAEGNENSMQFSVSFNTALLAYTGVALGSNATSGFIIASTNQLPSGRVGVFVLLPSNVTLPAGTQQVARINFNTALVTNTVITAVTFGDAPTVRQISDAQGIVIPATYANGSITIPFLGYEGDLYTRPNGDGSFTLADWQEVGRFVAGLDSPTNGNEFQRADCAPRAPRWATDC